MTNESISKTLLVAGALCVVCSVLVSAAAVRLKPLQTQNRALSNKKNVLRAAGLMEKGIDVESAFKKINARLVDLDTGQFVEAADPQRYDQRAAAKDPDRSVAIPDDKDVADIGRRAEKAPVYLVRKEGDLQTIILPIHGKGLWSTMYAYLAVAGNGNTIKGISFYEHGETPGLGGEVDNPRWRQKWVGKKIYDEDWQLELEVIKGQVNPQRPEATYRIDGLSGATLTTNGVNDMVRYWLGEHGFKTFLTRIREQGAENG